MIFHLGIGQRGLFHRGPHHRLGAAIELAAFRKLQQFGNDGRFRREVHGEIGFFPITIDAQPLQLAGLHIHPMLGIGAAFGAEFLRRHLVLVLLLGAIGFLDLPFDRQAVAIPAGHIGHILAQQRLGAHHRILQDMVERVADVHVPVRIGGAVVIDEFFPALTRGAQLRIKVRRLPFGQDLRFLLRQAGLHRKVGLGQENGGAIIGRAHDGPALGEAGGAVTRHERSSPLWGRCPQGGGGSKDRACRPPPSRFARHLPQRGRIYWPRSTRFALSASSAICAFSASSPGSFISGRRYATSSTPMVWP